MPVQTHQQQSEMSANAGDGAPEPGLAIDQSTPVHVVAAHGSLRRSLIALLKAWGALPVAFDDGWSFFRRYQDGADRPACTIVDTHGLDPTLTTFLTELRRVDPTRPVLILYGSAQRLERELASVDRRNLSSLLKPYRVRDLYAAMGHLLRERR
jgi:FixJ family two-component response regulator